MFLTFFFFFFFYYIDLRGRGPLTRYANLLTFSFNNLKKFKGILNFLIMQLTMEKFTMKSFQMMNY